MKDEILKKQNVGVGDIVNYAIHNPLSFTVNSFAGTAIAFEERIVDKDSRPNKQREVENRYKQCAGVFWTGLTGLVALALVASGVKGCSHQNKKATAPQQAQTVLHVSGMER